MDEKKISINISGFTLTLVFLILKLTHVIDWAWVWIFAPIWIPLGIVLIVFLIYLLVIAIRGY